MQYDVLRAVRQDLQDYAHPPAGSRFGAAHNAHEGWAVGHQHSVAPRAMQQLSAFYAADIDMYDRLLRDSSLDVHV